VNSELVTKKNVPQDERAWFLPERPAEERARGSSSASALGERLRFFVRLILNLIAERLI